MREDQYIPRPIMDEDSVDLAALRFALRQSEVRVTEIVQSDLPDVVQREMDLSLDRKAERTIGAIAAEGCMRFDGETVASSAHREAKRRHYSMYALHPETAEQIIAALEELMKSVGPRYRIPTRARTHTAKTVRNTEPQ